MKTICFYFQIHQPFRLKRYRFTNIGKDHYYYDDFAIEDIMQQLAQKSYIPANRALFEIIKNSDKKFKVAFSVSGLALEQMEIYAPEVIDGLIRLADTGCVEFLAETYAHSLSSLIDPIEFRTQVKMHSKKIEDLFGKKPKVFRNTELLYSDEIGTQVADLGFEGMLTEGAKRTLGWKSPNYVYRSASAPNLKLLLRNAKLSEDIAYKFSDYSWENYPLTADKFVKWIADSPKEEKVFNLFMNYETLGASQPKETGIFEFMKALPRFAESKKITFSTPSEVFENYQPIDNIASLHPMSWADEEKDTTAWLGNLLQEEAFKKLYENAERIRMSQSRRLKQDWLYMQSSDHFYYMGTKKHLAFSPYSSAYEAFNNYMNVLSDCDECMEAEYPSTIENEELNSLLKTIHNQADEIENLKEKLEGLTK